MTGDAKTILTEAQLHEVGQRLLALVPGGSEYFLKHGDGFKVDVFACLDFLERNRHARLELERIKKASEPLVSAAPGREYPMREIYRRPGRYVMCQIMTSWKTAADCPKYIACHDPNTCEQFIALQGMGTWMEVDIIFFEKDINKAAKFLNRDWLTRRIYEFAPAYNEDRDIPWENASHEERAATYDLADHLIKKGREYMQGEEPAAPKKALGPSMAQRDAIEKLIEYGNRNGLSDYMMAKAIAYRIFNWTQEDEIRGS